MGGRREGVDRLWEEEEKEWIGFGRKERRSE